MEGVTYMRDTWGETKRLDEREPRERRRLDDCRERREPLAIEGAHLTHTHTEHPLKCMGTHPGHM